jgi:hypothetical protein
MLAELRAPDSGINVTPCTDAFPPPPESVTKRACDPDAPSPVSDENFISTQQGHASAEQATAWYYCLTETSLRRTIDQILDVFYKNDHASWLERPVSLLLKSAHSFEEQLASWYASVHLISLMHLSNRMQDPITASRDSVHRSGGVQGRQIRSPLCPADALYVYLLSLVSSFSIHCGDCAYGSVTGSRPKNGTKSYQKRYGYER